MRFESSLPFLFLVTWINFVIWNWGLFIIQSTTTVRQQAFWEGEYPVRNSEQLPTCRCPQANKADRQPSSLLNSTHFNIIPHQFPRLLSSLLPSRFPTKPCRNFSSSPSKLHALPIWSSMTWSPNMWCAVWVTQFPYVQFYRASCTSPLLCSNMSISFSSSNTSIL